MKKSGRLASGIAFSVAALLLAHTSSLHAKPYELDRDHASITLAVDHLGFSMVRARFTEFSAEVSFDPDEPETSSIVLTIDADSFESFQKARDKAVKSKSLLYASKYPEIVFKSTEVEMLRGKQALVTGELTLRDVTREETFKVQLRRSGVSELTSVETAGFSVSGEIDRRDYDMNWGIGVIGAIIEFNFDFEVYVPK